MYLQRCREALSEEILESRLEPADPIPLADEYLASSILQKALRRGDRDYAQGAAVTLLQKDPARVWRRLTAIVCEDFGLADLALTASVTAAASNSSWRESVGGDGPVAALLIDNLVSCPRDRRVDELYMYSSSLRRGPSSEMAIGKLELSVALSGLIRNAVALIARCERPMDAIGRTSVNARECDLALARMCDKGWAGTDLYLACAQARRTSKTVLPVLIPLLQHQAKETCASRIGKKEAPETIDIAGIPSYALDGYTRPGRAALLELARTTPRLDRLIRHLRGVKPIQALTSFLFEIEGGICTVEATDPLYDELRTHSLGCWSGLTAPAFAEGLSLVRELIPALNHIRKATLVAA